MKKNLLILLVFFEVVFEAVIVQFCSASPVSDFYINQALNRYFILPDDAETLSMAGSTSGTCNNSNCLYLNPAGLGGISSFEVSSMLGFSLFSAESFPDAEGLEQSEYHGFGILSFPLGPIKNHRPQYGNLALGYSRYDGHTNDEINTTPDGHRRSIAYGISPLESVSLGYSFTFYDDQLRSEFADLHSHSRLLHVWGLQVRPTDSLEIATMFRLGIGQSDTEDFRFSSNGLSHLKEYSGVLAVKKKIELLTLASSFDYERVESKGELDGVALPVVIGGEEEGNIYNIRFGVSHPLEKNFLMRGGLRYQFVESYKFKRKDLENLSGDVRGLGLCVGLGYLLGQESDERDDQKIAFDYGSEYLNIGKGAWQHLVSVKIPISFAD